MFEMEVASLSGRSREFFAADEYHTSGLHMLALAASAFS
jgi:hypothetical protein